MFVFVYLLDLLVFCLLINLKTGAKLRLIPNPDKQNNGKKLHFDFL